MPWLGRTVGKAGRRRRSAETGEDEGAVVDLVAMDDGVATSEEGRAGEERSPLPERFAHRQTPRGRSRIGEIGRASCRDRVSFVV